MRNKDKKEKGNEVRKDEEASKMLWESKREREFVFFIDAERWKIEKERLKEKNCERKIEREKLRKKDWKRKRKKNWRSNFSTLLQSPSKESKILLKWKIMKNSFQRSFGKDDAAAAVVVVSGPRDDDLSLIRLLLLFYASLKNLLFSDVRRNQLKPFKSKRW